MGNTKRPVEVFGFPAAAKSPDAQTTRQRHWCPFVDLRCYKQSRIIDYPMGVCSVEYNGEIISICPRRFLEGRKIFEDIADQHFGTRNDLILFPEVGLKTIGTFDYVMVKHRPLSSEIEDFVVIEFQTGQTTGTGKLVQALRDVMNGEDISDRSYAFGMNTYDVWKRAFTQILNKGIVIESWSRKIYWVVQEQVFRYLVDRYHLHDMDESPVNSTVFSLYDLEAKGDRKEISGRGVRSASVDTLFQAFRTNLAIPPRQQFEAKLRTKLQANLGFTLS
ncbi:MAG: hypothetical protein HYX89_01640 [Chloroflexi bacterium]|nr:hypothetical protein [Chloroflexota bacterium]